MDTNNFVIQHKVKFLGNNGDFNEQPIFLLTTNNSLTGTDYINLSRLRTLTAEGASGGLVLNVSNSAGRTSSTSLERAIYAQSITSNGMTADSSEYTISTNMNNGNRIDVIIDINNNLLGVHSLSGFSPLNELKYLSMNGRVEPDENMVGYYTFNREELGTSITAVADRSNKGLTAALSGDFAGDATTSTVTGWTFGPNEGGFRFPGNESRITTDTTQNLNINSTSGSTYMTFFKINSITATNSQHIILSSGSAAGNTYFQLYAHPTEGLSVYHSNNFVGAIHNLVPIAQVDYGRWYHVTLTHSLSGALSGTYVYLNGLSSSFTGSPVMNMDTGAHLTWGDTPTRDAFGAGTRPLTGVVSNTKIWKKALSAEEVFQQYIGSIPNMIDLESIKIG